MSRTLADDLVDDIIWAVNELNASKPKLAAEVIEYEAHRGLIC